MRIFHTSDTHLGHQQYPRTDGNGLNQREQDIYDAWHKVVDLAVAEKPDLFLHAGDLFDGVRPGNRALAHAMEGFLELSRAGIPTVAIAGNHEHPKLRETGSPFRLFAHLPNVHMVYRGARETITIPTSAGTVRVHAVPQCADNATLASEVAAAPIGSDGTDILVAHGAVPSVAAFSHAEFNEQTLDPAWFGRFGYVALGHFHGVQEVAANAWYCGAPERVSMSEAGQEKGFLEVNLGAGSIRASFRPLAGRTYVDLPVVEAGGLDATALKAQAMEGLARAPAGAVARLRLAGIDPALRGVLDLRAIRQAGAHLMHLDLRLDWATAGLDARGGTELRGVLPEFDAFAATQPAEGVDRERLVAAARTVLEAAT
ncbi:MAG: exonuclease SbcCD subunit D [Thermoplasmatota archaeon]